MRVTRAPLYLLTCPEGYQRLDFVCNQIQRVFGRNPSVFTNTSCSDGRWQAQVMPVADDCTLRPEQICCASGHLRMYLEFLTTTTAPYAFFFEDDCAITASTEDFDRAIDDISRGSWDWCILEQFWPDHVWLKPTPKTWERGVVCEYEDTYLAYQASHGTACYAVSREGAMKLLRYNLPIRMASDSVTRDMARLPEVRAFTAKRPFAYQADFPSTHPPLR